MTQQLPNDTEQGSNANLAGLLRQLSAVQMRYVAARVWADSDADAARECGVHPKTVCRWKSEGAPIDQCIELMRYDGVIMAAEMFRRALVDAVTVKVDGLLERNASIRQNVATEIIERNLGKPVQKQEVSGSIQVVVNDLGPFGD